MRIIEGGVCAVPGVKAYGKRDENNNGLAIITGKGNAVGVFAQNRIRAAPVIVMNERLPGVMNAIIANSGCANAFTGERGLEDAKRMAQLVADELGVNSKSVGVASTGIIGHYVDMDWIEEHVKEVMDGLTSEPGGSEAAARAIMTTDTILKQVAVEVDGVRIGGMAKGSGMVEPNMNTVLVFIYTDADFSYDVLYKCLKTAVDDSFNMIVVDGDASTNDMALLTAVGKGRISEHHFQEGLNFVCTELAKMIARDGEGATKLIEVNISGAISKDDARRAAKAVVRSLLVKTAVYGESPNWGRIVSAIGRSGADVEADKITLEFSDGVNVVTLVKEGNIIEGVLDQARALMARDAIVIKADLGLGSEGARAWGCDLTCDYVRINAEYMT
ncbi:MAG: bifunctional ornithine acetyltransferase/N-acetylglutamate synthase [Methanocellales archaeon]|nr:bifunctional ornithine acetyltransferase/N-acetylglutamate synthase [Methanocellales archaeon]